ncbi:MAG TPA: hypothetical protein VF314_10415 [Actinomycetes bacterium]
MNETDSKQHNGLRRWGGAGALAAAGLVAGGVLAGTLSASADSSTSTPGTGSNSGPVDESRSQRPDEHLLSGDTASKVRAAALAKYPGATIQRVETDSDGVYEAHLTTSDGKRVTVEMDKSFTVTGEESAPAGGPGHRPRDRDGRGGPGSTGSQTPSGSASSGA